MASSLYSKFSLFVVGRRDSASVSPTPQDFALAKDEEDREAPTEHTGTEQVLAADYDPSLDRREDERKRFGDQAQIIHTVEDVEEEDVEEEEDLDDMFSVAFSDKPKVKKVKKKITVSLFVLALFPLKWHNNA